MRLGVDLENYRCFPKGTPAEFSIGDGFTAVVGPNNAGKSAALRMFWELRRLWEQLASVDSPLWVRGLQGGQRSGFGGIYGLPDQGEVFPTHNDLDVQIVFTLDPETATEEAAIRAANTPRELRAQVSRDGLSLSLQTADPAISIATDLRWDAPGILAAASGGHDLMPWIALFSDLARSVYVPAFRGAVSSTRAQYYDLAIGQEFVLQWANSKGALSDRNMRDRALRLELEVRDIFGFDRFEIGTAPERDALILTVDGSSFRLDELGSGIAQFIVALIHVADKRPPFVFIDEPETNLHPSLQLGFLSSLQSHAQRGVVFATHSIGLARAGATHVYSVHRASQGIARISELSATRNYAEFIGEMSLSGYRELGFEQILLVEGPTEVMALQPLLRLIGLDHKIVMIHLGGGSSIHAGATPHLEEIMRVTKRVAVVIDSERKQANASLEPRRAGFVEACQRVGITDLCVLERLATDNYWTADAVRKALGPDARALTHFERHDAETCGWNKSQSPRIAAAMTKDELLATDLGKFLAQLAPAVV